jgi:peptidoglycan biosynthesis protein MviN/MurJ (putative lipid II flippase)
MPTTLLQGTGAHIAVALFSAGGAVANLILSVLFVRVWGVVGIAAATLVASSVVAVLVFPRSCQAVGLTAASGCQAIVVPAVWPALVATSWVVWVQSQLSHGVLSVLLTLVGGGIIYALLFLSFGIDADERRWLRVAGRRLLPAPQLAAGEVVRLP